MGKAKRRTNLIDRGDAAPVLPVPELLERARQEGRQSAILELQQALTREAASGAVPVPPGINTMGATHAPGAYHWNNPWTYYTPQAPYRRPGAQVTVETLRTLAATYDPLRSCINHLKREVRTTPFEVVPKNRKDKGEATMRRCEMAQQLFSRQGPVGGHGKLFRHFESAVLEDAIVVGAAAIWHERSVTGKWLSCDAIDASTIRPVVDQFGWPPPPDLPQFEQWVLGVWVATFRADELTYDGLHAQSWQPYYSSPVEWLVLVVNGALAADQWNRSWLTTGSTPSDTYSLPEAWGADDIIKFSQWWDALKAGDAKARTKTAFVPGGSKNVGSPSRRDQEFSEYELWLMRRTCSIMGVSPASIGYVGEQYKVSQDAAMAQTSAFGVGDLLTMRKAWLDDILVRAGFEDLEIVDVHAQTESQKDRAETNEVLIRSGQRTINEARRADGEDPIEGGDSPLVSSTLRPLEQALAPPPPPTVPAPADPGKPDPTKPDPKKPDPKPSGRVERRSALERALDSYRSAMLEHEESARSATAQLWAGAEKAIRADLEALQARIEELATVGGAATPEMLAADRRYQELLATIEREIDGLADGATDATQSAQAAGIEATLGHVPVVARAAAGPAPVGITLPWNEPDVDAVRALIGFASDGSPLRDLFVAIGPDLARAATQVLVTGVTTGEGPAATARALSAVLNVSRARAEAIARTEAMRAFREASRQSFEANQDVVEGWVWTSALGTRTCAACWAKHGTIHPASETLHAHVQCRCVAVPRTRAWGEIVGDPTLPDDRPEIETGAELFAGLTDDQQREILGPGVWELYQSGAIALADMARTDIDPRWGPSVRPATLAELSAEMGRWERKAIARLKSGRGAACRFETALIPADVAERISAGLAAATTAPQIKAVFRQETAA